MPKTGFKQKLQAYEQWKADIVRTIEDFSPWLKKHGMASHDSDMKIRQTLEALSSDRLNIAFVAEFSRGKTELINAIFFADYGKRLLPSTAGRTTMCPTELFYDEDENKAYVRLLPIETRFRDTTLGEYKADPRYWVNIPLELDSAEQMENALKEVVQTKKVSVEEAGRLGLYNEELQPHQSTPASKIEIPKWRHALISFPHPLLKSGLSILDTPGLNALGSEPELTLNMLPQAQAVLFVLAADTGVTKTDLEMWQHHIKGFQTSRQRGLVVVLNKIDTLWDELNEHDQIHGSIAGQRDSTAKILGISKESIFPVSAQKALLAKIKHDDALLDRSAVIPLEDYLSRDILGAKQQIVLDTVSTEVGLMVNQTRGVIAARLANVKKQMDELNSLNGKSSEVVKQMMTRTREEQAQYLKHVAEFQRSQRMLAKQGNILRNALDLDKLDKAIQAARQNMSGSWTTAGLKKAMKTLFEDMRESMQVVVDHSEQTRKTIRKIYQKFQREHDFPVIQPKMFSVMKYRVDLELLYQEAEIFRKSSRTTLTEQSFVIKRFFISMGSRARDIFFQARQESDTWLDTVLEPLMHQVKDHKEMMEKQLASLQKINKSKNTLQERIVDLKKQYRQIAAQLTALRNMHKTLTESRPLTGEDRPKPALVIEKDQKRA